MAPSQWRTRASVVGTGVLVILGLVGCGLIGDQGRVSWSQVSKDGFLDNKTAAFFFSAADAKSEGSGSAAFLGSDGTLKSLRLKSLEWGEIVWSPRGDVSFSSGTETFDVAGRLSRRWKREGPGGGGHWFGTTPSGLPVTIFNVGAGESGYLTDSYLRDGNALRRLSANIVPDGVGLTDRDLYIQSAYDEQDPTSMSMIRVPLNGSAARQTWRWEPWGSTRGWLPNFYSDVFLHSGRAWFLEDIYPTDGDGEPTTFSRGMRSQIRIGSVRLSDGRYESQQISDSKGRSRIQPAGTAGWNGSAQATLGAHRTGDTLMWVDSRGLITSLRLGATDPKSLCGISRRTASAGTVRAAWDGSSLSLAAVKGNHAWIETVATSPSCSRRVREVPSVATYLRQHPDQVMSGYARRPSHILRKHAS